MAENLVVNEVTYPDVEAIAMTNDNGEKVAFYPDAVRYKSQALTDTQKAQARTNIGAASSTEVSQLSSKIDDLQSGAATVPDYWKSHLDSKIAAIKVLQDEGGKDAFSFIVIADPHYPQNLGKNSGKLAKKITDECDIKYVLVLGDMQSRGQHGTKADALADFDGIREMFKPVAENVLYQRGNHDGSWGSTLNGVTYPYNFKPEELYNRIHALTYKYHNAVTDESGTGYYVDDTARKVRYILLNSHCNPYEENEDGSAKYSNMKNARFTQSQYDMLIDALKTVPGDSWSVVVAAHMPIVEAYADAWGGSDGDFIIMRNLLKAYKTKGKYSVEWSGTADGSGGGYTNLFDVNGDGFTVETEGSKYLTNWMPYNYADNNNTGTIYHFKGFADNAGYTNPYKMQFKAKTGVVAGDRPYCTNANQKANIVADYDSIVRLVQHSVNNDTYNYIRFEFREALPANLIITANEQIVESSGGDGGYDTVSIDVDFSAAKGKIVGYFAGHMHNDYTYKATDGYGVNIITTRCDGANENDSTLLAERVAGTVTEQSFDVFTVNRKTGKVNATKIGAGADREISY